ncbi:MAG TPA: hypothetical protein VL333_02950 [Candidatus Saccharimonadales bacterium]|nr:hypothetical protein [Candidatus Saccharimonadales bacterium]
MINTEAGVYLQFFDEGESIDRELPPLGPFELLIIRHNRIIGDREQVEHDSMGLGAVERWLEAELELRRALGDEPGGNRRSHMRIRAPRGDIIVRFYDYGGDEPPKVPELGPFYALTIGKREVRADDQLIAIRSTDLSPWTLTEAARPGVAGVTKADFSVFSLSVREARPAPDPVPPPTMLEAAGPVVAAAEPVVETPWVPQREFVERRKVQRELYVARPDAQREQSLTPADVETAEKLKQQALGEQLMIERLRREQRVSPEAALQPQPSSGDLAMRFQPPVREREAARAAADEAAEYEDEPFTTRVLRFLWSARLIIVTVLLVAALFSAYGYLQPKVASNGAPPPLTFAALGDKIQTADWTYTVTSVERAPKLGTVPATSGGYLVVHLTATKTNADAPPLSTSNFQLIDAAGARGFAFDPTSDIYTSNLGLVWASRYPTTQPVQDHLVFDVSPTARALILFIKDANVQVRLPDP